MSDVKEINLKNLLALYYEEKGYKYDGENDKDLYDTFEDCAEVVWMSEPDHHRWYTNYQVVRCLTVGGEDYFYNDWSMSVDGDNSRSDCGWEAPDVEDLVQVFPKEVLTTAYVTKDKL